jgi:hypothetical protein
MRGGDAGLKHNAPLLLLFASVVSHLQNLAAPFLGASLHQLLTLWPFALTSHSLRCLRRNTNSINFEIRQHRSEVWWLGTVRKLLGLVQCISRTRGIRGGDAGLMHDAPRSLAVSHLWNLTAPFLGALLHQLLTLWLLARLSHSLRCVRSSISLMNFEACQHRIEVWWLGIVGELLGLVWCRSRSRGMRSVASLMHHAPF